MSTDNKDIDIYIKEYYNDYYDNELICTMGNMLEKLNKLNIKFSDSSLSGQKNWINAFGFILEHLMMRGRSDKLSYNYTNIYLNMLDYNMNVEDIQNKINILDKVLGSTKMGKLENQQKNKITGYDLAIKLGIDGENISKSEYKYKLNENDIKMVMDLLCFQKKIFENTKNIFDYLVTLISEHSVIETYQRLTQIDYVGDKLAAFTLRDIMFLSEKSKTIKLKPYDYLLLFPIDTRVNQKAMEILGIDEEIDPLILKIKLINLCEEQGFIEKDRLAPLKLNAGMWYNFENNKSKIDLEQNLEGKT